MPVVAQPVTDDELGGLLRQRGDEVIAAQTTRQITEALIGQAGLR